MRVSSTLVKPKLSRKEKVLKYLETANTKEVNNNDLIMETGIDRSNMPKILKPLEQKGLIHRRYEQVGRAKYVWVSLTNSHVKTTTNLTNSQSSKMTNSHIDNQITLEKDNKQVEFKTNSTNSQIKTTNSQSSKMTNSHIDNQITLEKDNKQVEFKTNSTNSQIKTTNSHIDNEDSGTNLTNSQNIRGPESKILTINSIFEDVIEYTSDKKGKGYERINKILKSHDKNRNYQSNIIRDSIEILIEMGKVR